MHHKRHVPLSQNFLHDRKLVHKLVDRSSVDSIDTILEIGPGKGIITHELLQVAQHVVAVEIDSKLCVYLRSIFSTHSNFLLFQEDILQFPLPLTPYKVFANLPFEIEGKILRRLIDAPIPPQEINVVVIKDVAYRWVGIPKEGLFSLTYKPWFEFAITHHFSRRDFVPVPKVDSVMLSVRKRKQELIDRKLHRKYLKFIADGFGGGRRLSQNLRSYFLPTDIKVIEKKLGISFDLRPSDVRFEQWIQLFTYIPECNHSS